MWTLYKEYHIKLKNNWRSKRLKKYLIEYDVYPEKMKKLEDYIYLDRMDE